MWPGPLRERSGALRRWRKKWKPFVLRSRTRTSTRPRRARSPGAGAAGRMPAGVPVPALNVTSPAAGRVKVACPPEQPPDPRPGGADRGALRGAPTAGTGRIVDDPDTEAAAYRAFDRKYGWQMRLVNTMSRLAGRIDGRAVLEIRLGGAVGAAT